MKIIRIILIIPWLFAYTTIDGVCFDKCIWAGYGYGYCKKLCSYEAP